MQLHIDIKGDKALTKKLENEKKIKNPLAKFLELAHKIVTNQAKEFSPVDMGFLRASWSGRPAIEYFLQNKDKYFKALGDNIEKEYKKK